QTNTQFPSRVACPHAPIAARTPRCPGPPARANTRYTTILWLLPRFVDHAPARKSAARDQHPVTLDDHSEVAPPLPIPNRIVKRLCADDSGRTSVKVGHRQALIPQNPS